MGVDDEADAAVIPNTAKRANQVLVLRRREDAFRFAIIPHLEVDPVHVAEIEWDSNVGELPSIAGTQAAVVAQGKIMSVCSDERNGALAIADV